MAETYRPEGTGGSSRDAEVKSAPLVSVILPARNAAATIERALNSVLQQDYRPLEVIVVDDDSSDDTAARIDAWGAMPVTVLSTPGSQGPAAARNLGADAATGKYLAFLDADDEWLPEKTTRQVAALERAPAATFAICDGDFLDRAFLDQLGDSRSHVPR